jgi:hypothetical protein
MTRSLAFGVIAALALSLGIARAAERDVDRTVGEAIKPLTAQPPLTVDRPPPPAPLYSSPPPCGPTTTPCADQVRRHPIPGAGPRQRRGG